MKYQKYAFIGCRVVALFLLMKFVANFAFVFPDFIAQAAAPSSPSAPSMLSYFLVQVIGFELGPFLVFWFGAGFFAKRITDHEWFRGDVTEGKEAGIEGEALLTAAVSCLGLYLIVMNGSVLAQNLMLVNSNSSLTPGYLGAPLISVIFGALFVLGSRKIAGFISRLRKAS